MTRVMTQLFDPETVSKHQHDEGDFYPKRAAIVKRDQRRITEAQVRRL
jgi:hypothetical protein